MYSNQKPTEQTEDAGVYLFHLIPHVMIDQLKQIVQSYAGDSIIRNDAIPNEKNDAAIDAVTSGIMDGLRNSASQGNYQELISMFQQSASNGFSSLSGGPANNIVQQVVSSLASKVGISPAMAEQVSASLIPHVMNQFASKTADPNDNAFDLQDMLRNFSGKNDLNIADIVSQFSGGGNKGNVIGDTLGKIFGNR